MEIALSKKTILSLLLYLFLFLWLIFSIIYIANDIWSDYRNVQLVNAYNQGRTDTINALITEAEKCQPFSVFSDDKEIQLMKVNCPPAEGQ